MTRRDRRRMVNAGSFGLLASLVAWDAAHGHWENIAYTIGVLILLIGGMVIIDAWINRGDS